MKTYHPVNRLVSDMPVLVPGAGVLPDGSMYERGLARLDVVSDSILQCEVEVPELYLCGGITTPNMPPEATVMHEILQFRLPEDKQPKRTIIEVSSKNTMQNILNVSDYILEAQIRELAVVTDMSHMGRVLKLADAILPNSLRILPVVDAYVPTSYESNRERVARLVTKATLFGVPSGVGATEVKKRQAVYERTKSLVRPTR